MSSVKEWLIRTRSRHILGPVSKAKIIELIENKSINEYDEICPGNGYWFYIREKDLINKHIYSDAKMDFNPVSEAKDSLNVKQLESSFEVGSQVKRENSVPEVANDSTIFDSTEDLDAEDITGIVTLGDIKKSLSENKSDDLKVADEETTTNPSMPSSLPEDITEGGTELNAESSDDDDDDGGFSVKLPADADLEYPKERKIKKSLPKSESSEDIDDSDQKLNVNEKFMNPQTADDVIKDTSTDLAKVRKKLLLGDESLEKKNDRGLIYLFVILIIVLLAFLYYHQSKLKSMFSTQSFFLNEVHAQTPKLQKKK